MDPPEPFVKRVARVSGMKSREILIVRARKERNSLEIEEEPSRIDRNTVDAHLVVEVRSGRAAGIADAADQLPALHLLAELHVLLREVGVLGDEAVAVIDADH